jgi:hypothetical protein
VLVGGIGIGLVLVRAPRCSPRDTRDDTLDLAPGDFRPTARLRRGISRRPVDPASPAYKGGETDEWDSLPPSERVDRVERAIATALTERVDVERAQMILSAARADFYASDAGARRYLELEQALVGAGARAGSGFALD